jgi:hypothetical protein
LAAWLPSAPLALSDRAGHAAIHEAIARALDDLPEWAHAPEVAFSIYGERGVIDILAFHARSQSISPKRRVRRA